LKEQGYWGVLMCKPENIEICKTVDTGEERSSKLEKRTVYIGFNLFWSGRQVSPLANGLGYPLIDWFSGWWIVLTSGLAGQRLG